jgi:HK97 family phage portal protein
MSEDRVLSDVVWTPERGLQEPEVRSVFWNNLLNGDDGFTGKTHTSADIRITPDTALQSTVVLAACRILAETIASLPLHVYRRTPDGYKELARDIPLYKVLSFAPNEWQTKFEFFEQMVMNLTLWGNSYSRIRSGRYGSVSALDNYHPSNMDIERLENGRLRYQYMNPETGRLEAYTQDEIMHVRWTPEPDGMKGMVPVEIAREAIALARACEIHAGRFWANSARPGIVLQTDNSLSAEAAERLRDNWERIHRGVDRASRTAILTNGLKIEQVGFSAEQSQYESTRRFQSEEIARVYRLPLSLIQGQSSGSHEENGQEFVTYTLVPWLRRIESAISRSLIYNDDLFFAEFDTKGLMRGNSTVRAGFYSTMLNLGLMTHNECRKAENLPPMGEIGDHHMVAMNLQPLEEALKPKDQGGGMPGAPPEAAGGVPSLPEVKTGKTPMEAEQGEASEKKPEEPRVEYAEGKFGSVKHVMDRGTLDLKSGEKIEVEPGKPVALVVDEETGDEIGVEVSKLKPVEEKPAVEEKRDLSPQSKALCEAQEQIAETTGRWSQSDSHYTARSPFANRGLVCRNCVHYEPDGSCEIVKGPIAPDAICKLWVIPPEKMVEARSPEEENRAADCGRDEGGRFGPKNQCQDDGAGGGGGGGSATATSPAGEPDSVHLREPPDVKLPPPVRKIDTEKLLEKISQNPNGFTLDPYSAEQPLDGIMVSEFKNDSRRSVKLKASEVNTKAGRDAFAAWLAQNADVLDGADRFVGGWRDGDDFYIDIATRFPDDQAERALEVGRDSGQLAVFNLKTFKETWVQYDSGDSRKPDDWDRAFAKARKSAQVSQVYDKDSPDLQDEDIAAELSRHGKKTVRAYNPDEENLDDTAAKVRRPRRREKSSGDIPRDADLLREGRGIEGRETRSELVRRRPGPDAATLPGQEAVGRMIKAAEEACRHHVGDSFPRVEVRSIGNAAAVYSAADDTLYVSPDFHGEPPQSGWLSCDNPLIHEVSHRLHHLADPDSYRESIRVEFSPEQRSMIESEVSRYAATNGREFVAEYLAGRLSGHTYSEGVERLAEEVFSDVIRF